MSSVRPPKQDWDATDTIDVQPATSSPRGMENSQAAVSTLVNKNADPNSQGPQCPRRVGFYTLIDELLRVFDDGLAS